MENKIAMIYPFTLEHVSLLRSNMLPYSGIYPVSLEGFQYENYDAGALDMGTELNIKVTCNYEDMLKSVDEVVFTDINDYILDKIKLAIEHKKDIVCLERDSKYEKHIQKLCADGCVKYTCNFLPEVFKISDNNTNIALFDVPIVCVCGMSESTQKFDILLEINKQLKQKGYKVSCIAARSNVDILSIHNFPQFLFDKNYEYDKILYFNNYIKSLELTEYPDIILLEIPGGVIPYDLKHNNQFGVFAYLISQAINSIDYSIFSMAYDTYNKEFYDFISLYMKYRFGFTIDMFHMSNCYHDLEPDGNEDIILMSKEKVLSKIKSNDYGGIKNRLFNVFCNPDRMIENILSKLGDQE